MSTDCPVCSKRLSSKYIVIKHMQVVHNLDANGQLMECDQLSCSSGRCDYTTVHKGDLKKHELKCPHILVDQEIKKLQTEFVKQYELLHNNLTTEFTQEKQNLIAEFAQERQSLTAQLHEYSQIISKQQGEIDMLQRHLDKAYEQVDQNRQGMERIAEKAIARPTTVQTTNQQNYGTVKISNYLADNDTYRRQTERDFIMQQANAHLQKYIEELVNGQEALAKFVVAHIIKRADSNEYILCCTDTSRKRFLYINHLGEKEEDMLAKLFVSHISGPIREVSGSIFKQIEERLQREREAAKGGEKINIDNKIMVTNDKYLKMMEFDISDKNGDFVAELAGMLRGTNAIES